MSLSLSPNVWLLKEDPELLGLKIGVIYFLGVSSLGVLTRNLQYLDILRWIVLARACAIKPSSNIAPSFACSSAFSLPSVVLSRIQFAVGTKFTLRSLPSMTHATDSKSLQSVSAVRSRKSVNDPSAFLPNFTSKVAACEYLPSAQKYKQTNVFFEAATTI